MVSKGPDIARSAVPVGNLVRWQVASNRAICWSMRDVSNLIWLALVGLLRSRASLEAEILVLRHQLGDKAYDSAELREELSERGTKPVIPNRSNRKQAFSFNKRLYRLRWRIESAFNRLKDFRRIATRYDRLARNYLASVCLAAALVWWI